MAVCVVDVFCCFVYWDEACVDRANEICACIVDDDCDDGNPCTAGLCNSGICEYPPQEEGTLCGDPPTGECDAQDTCDGLGTCIDRFADAGTACGDPNETECDYADICGGAGECTPNFAANGAPCGDSSQWPCDLPDTCDGYGVCDPNILGSGESCSDGQFCNGEETCTGGECLDGPDPCDAICNEETDVCIPRVREPVGTPD